MAVAEIRNLTYKYGMGTPFEMTALDDVTIAVGEGMITGLIGHTGSGKSTLVQMLNGLLKPNEGSVIVNGRDIWENPKEIGKVRFEVGLVMQYPEYQLFDETVRADIAYGPKNMGLSESETAERVEEAAGYVGLEADLLEKSPFDLSGGQKRRAAIAGVIAMRPKLLILDEPAAGLDPRGREDILGGLRAWREMQGASVLIVSHSMEDMARYCDRIIVMNRGRIYKEGTTADIFCGDCDLSSVGLNTPQITRIAARLRECGVPLPPDIFTVERATDVIAALLRDGKGGECNA